MKNKRNIIARRSRDAAGEPGKNEKFAAALMIAAVVLFNLYITAPLMNNGVNDAGDDLYHMSQAHYLKKLILEEHMIFGVVDSFGAGYPWFNTHQFLMYATEAGISIISLDRISILDAHKLLLILFYSLFPVGIYYLLIKFGQPPTLAGTGALLAATPISGWGHTITSYFIIGLSSQAMGGFLFPFAAGSFHELITTGRGHMKTAFLCVMTAFAHPYYGYFLAFTSIIDIAVHIVGKRRKEAFSAVKYAAMAGIVGLLLAVFWLYPLSEAMKYAPRNLEMQAVKNSFSLKMAATYYFNGGLLDVSNNFGDLNDKNFRWPINTASGRLPVLTVLSILGVVYSLVWMTRFRAVCVLGLIVSFVLLVGSDDIPVLGYLPMSEHANPKRTIYLFEFFAILLSAVSAHMILKNIYSVAERFIGMKAAALVVALILIGVIYTPYYERMKLARTAVNTLSYWMPSFNAIGREIKKDGFDGREFGDDEVDVKSATVILSQPWLTDTPSFRRIYCTRFWGAMFDFPNVFRMFNVRYLITGPDKAIPPRMKPIMTEIWNNRLYRLYRVEGDFGPGFISHKKPVLVLSTESGWRVISEVWLHYYKNNTNGDYMPYLVEYLGQDIESDGYSQLMQYDMRIPKNIESLFSGRLARYNGSKERHKLVRDVMKDGKKVASKDVITTLAHTPNRFVADVETDKPGLMVYKTTYHPNWKAIVDGKKYDTLRVSPEYPAVFIEPGEHTVEFRYEQSALQQMLNIISFATLLYVLAPANVIRTAAGKRISSLLRL